MNALPASISSNARGMAGVALEGQIAAAKLAWKRTVAHFKKHLGS